VLAANIGAGSTVGATGLGYEHGLGAWWWNGSAGIGTLLLAFWIGPRIWREASRRGFLTVGDFLEERFGRGIRGLVAVLIWLGTLSILAGQLIGIAWILQVVAGIPRWAGCLIGGGVMTAYFAAGGLLASAWVNLVQLVVLVAGFTVALPLVLGGSGGASVFLCNPVSLGLPEGHGTFWHGSSSVGFLVLLVPAFIASPGLLQKAYGARDARALRLGIGLSGLALLAFAFVPALLGMAARVLHPGLAHAELALPTLFVRNLPAPVGALALAAVFSAEVSTADAILFMLSTSLSQDLYRRFVNPAAPDAVLLRVARLAAVAGGAAGIALALWSASIIRALSLFYALLGVTLFVPIVAGLMAARPSRAAAVGAIFAGIGTDLLFRAVPLAVPPWLTPELAGLTAASLAAIFAGRWLRKDDGQ
jgi:SSS family solute:Na+ symporter